MLIELKRCNSIGNINGLLFLISIIAGKGKIGREEIRNRCSLENGIVVNCPGAIAFLEYLRLIETQIDDVIPTYELDTLSKDASDTIVKNLVKRSINRLVEDGIFDKDTTGFDADKGCLTIKRSAFPLAYAAIRNFLITAGALNKEEYDEISVGQDYENDWTSQLSKYRKKLSLEQLLKQQEERSKRGLEAEEFVLKLEQMRLPTKGNKIKRISDFDVSAGYDIVSFDRTDSVNYDRFIEVKSYIGSLHFFWSENEYDVAKIKGDEYILCLVDYSQINVPGYLPEYIANPCAAIFESGDWLINSASYRIQKI